MALENFLGSFTNFSSILNMELKRDLCWERNVPRQGLPVYLAGSFPSREEFSLLWRTAVRGVVSWRVQERCAWRSIVKMCVGRRRVVRRVVLRMKQGSFRRGSSQTLLLLLFMPLPTLLFQFGLLLRFNLLLIASLFLLISWGRIFCLILVILLVGGVADFTPFLNTSVHSLEISGIVLASVMS